MRGRRVNGDSAAPLCGRQTECAALDGLLERVRGGRSAVLVLRGEAGIGKTALLRYVADRATGFQVARCMGVESEMELAFTGLHDVCAPQLSHVDALIEPQREALGVALGLKSGEPPEPFLVAVAALNLFAVAGEARPLLCVVDDVQWLDHASAQVLGFVARRLLAEPVALVFAARTSAGDDSLAGLPDLRLSGLAEPSARALLASVSTALLDESVRHRIMEEAHGNPLALLELGSVDFAGGFAMPDAVDVPRRIQDQYLTRLRGLPEQTQRLMLVAAADPVGDPGLLQRAAHVLGLDIEAAEPAAEAGLLDLGAAVRFRHPLLRSAVYRGADTQERRAAHAALAEASDPGLDPDRQAWHRAYAAGAADEEVAAELIGSAGRAARRGGVAAAAAFWERAVALTPDPARRAERALAAAEAKFAAGNLVAAQDLLSAADVGAFDELGRARVELMRARIAFKLNRGADAPALLLHTAHRLRPLDDDLTRQTLLEALLAAVYVGQLASGGGLREVARSAKAAPFGPDPLPHPQLMLRGLAVRVIDGYSAAVPLLKEALRQYLSDPAELDMLCHSYTFVATDLWDGDAWLEIARRQMQLARPTGTLSRVVEALSVLALVSIHEGDLTRAEALIAEEEHIQLGITQPLISYSKVLLAAWRGDPERALDLMNQMAASGSDRGEGLALVGVEYATAVLYNGLADYEPALEAAHRASSADTLGIPDWALYELVEAAVKSGQPSHGSAACDRLSQIAEASGAEWARGTATLARALMADAGGAEEADDLYREAIELFGRTRMASALPRARLCYGEWLRSNNRASEASTQLRAAFDTFTAMGAKGFAERARRELEANGEKVRASRRDPSADLTPQEHQIAQLARTRRTNAEIGALVFLGVRTVEWHLHNIFAKLGIGARYELDAALSGRERQTTSATSDP
ncbi:AAA family ATPase [Mycobacterium sp.]|uniref:AAA family ATPase n=1 Tax=Mycobacterium sp. TaxID=1785 RepID=UPI002C7444FB|nr:AAA family ATPase [Mycobacterium sp.]HTY31770.1 AAA family ATPase [Mycobacterium sp.]